MSCAPLSDTNPENSQRLNSISRSSTRVLPPIPNTNPGRSKVKIRWADVKRQVQVKETHTIREHAQLEMVMSERKMEKLSEKVMDLG